MDASIRRDLAPFPRSVEGDMPGSFVSVAFSSEACLSESARVLPSLTTIA
jgi:hypothetical protein